MNRRELLSAVSVAGVAGIGGCSEDSGNGSGDGGDGAGSSEEAEEDDWWNENTPETYYGLPECDGSQPIQLLEVNGGIGTIRNITTDDMMVLIRHQDPLGLGNGDYCGAYEVSGGERIGYAVSSDGQPEEVEITAAKDNSTTRRQLCDNTNDTMYQIWGSKGCVDPDNFDG